MHCPLYYVGHTSHTQPARGPSGLQARDVILARNKGPPHQGEPAVTFHTCTPCRLVPQANCCPSGLQAIAKKTVSGWSGSWCLSTQAPEVGFHSRMVLSHPLLASNLPLGLHPTAETTPRCPRNTRGGLAPVISQTVTIASEPPLASWVPSGLQSIPKREDT